ncbi:MAG: hypothetical protein ACLP9K_05830 [Nitrososphaerales archaeon]
MTLKILLGYELRHYDGKMSREAWLDRLASHFRSATKDLKRELEFWERIESAVGYGLVDIGFGPASLTDGANNLRELVRRCEALEQQEKPIQAFPLDEVQG